MEGGTEELGRNQRPEVNPPPEPAAPLPENPTPLLTEAQPDQNDKKERPDTVEAALESEKSRQEQQDQKDTPPVSEHSEEKPTKVHYSLQEEQRLRKSFKESGESIHTASRETKEWLAKVHKRYTTTTTRTPGKWWKPKDIWNFHKQQKTAKELAKLRNNAEARLRAIPEFKNEEHLGFAVSDLFRTVGKVEMDGIYVIPLPEDKQTQGVVAAKETRFPVPDGKQAELLAMVLSTLLATPSNETSYPVKAVITDVPVPYVRVTDLTEYFRAICNATGELMKQDYYTTTCTVLPINELGKRGISVWKKSETFDPAVEKRMMEMHAEYLARTSQEDIDLRLEKGKDIELLGTDTASAFREHRDKLRAAIDAIRGDGKNRELHLLQSQQFCITQNVHLTRSRAKNAEEARYPMAARTHSTVEQFQLQAQKALQEAKQNKLVAVLKGIKTAVTGVGIESAIDWTIENVKNIWGFVGNLGELKRKWQEQGRQAEDERQEIIQLLANTPIGATL